MIVIDAVKTGENLRNLMIERGLNYIGLSRIAGIHYDSVYAWFNGKNLPPLNFLLSIAVEFGVPMASILAVTMDDGIELRGDKVSIDSLEGGQHGDC